MRAEWMGWEGIAFWNTNMNIVNSAQNEGLTKAPGPSGSTPLLRCG